MDRPQIGVAVAIRRDNKLLIHKRKGKHASGFWAFPGGHLEMWETFECCALREIIEEAGPDLRITTPEFFTAINTPFFSEEKHYVSLIMVCDWISGEPVVMEPDKCECWVWSEWNNLPHPLMLGLHILYNKGMNPLEYKNEAKSKS